MCKMSGVDPPKKTSRLPTKIARPTSIKFSEKSGTASLARESNTSIFVEDTDNFIVGDRVWVGGTKPGVIAFVGETQFGPGDWAGVVLDDPYGKNDGSIAGIRYFQCAPNRGIFSRLTRLARHPMPVTSCLSPSIPEHIRVSRPSSIVSGGSVADLTTIAVSSGSSKTPNSIDTSPNDTMSTTTKSDLKIGDRVIAQSSRGSKIGILRYCGNVEFDNGIWCGIELDDPIGKNDGSVGDIRYFECAPKFGLFVPVEKVSKSPVSKRTSSSCAIHTSGLSRQGTSDSLRSASTAFTSVSGMKSLRTPSKYSTMSSQATPALKQTTEQASEKDKYIRQLLKERELERAQTIRAATQAEEVEKKLATLKTEYDKATMDREIEKTNFQRTIDSLEKEKDDLQRDLDDEKKKIEELIFTYEEESLTKSEIQALNEEYAEKLKKYEAGTTQEPNFPNETPTNEQLKISGSIQEFTSVIRPISFKEESSQTDSVAEDTTEKIEMKKRELMGLIEKRTLEENELSDLAQKIVQQENLFNDIMHKTVEKKNVLDDLIQNISTKERSLNDFTQKTCLKEGEFENLMQKTIEKERLLNELERKIALKECELVDFKNKITAQETVEQNMEDKLNQFQSNVDNLTDQLNRLTEQLSEKNQQYSRNTRGLVNYLRTISNFMKERNETINSVIVGIETLKNVESVLRKQEIIEDPTNSEAFDGRCELEDEFSTLREQLEKMMVTNLTLLEKLETLTEIIKKKDALLEETMTERDTWRQEFKEMTESKSNEIKQLECRFSDLNKVKIDIENQLQKSEEKVKKLESTVLNAKETNQSEILSLLKDLEVKNTTHNQLMEEINNLKKELTRLNDENTSLQNQNSNIRTMIKSEESDDSTRGISILNGSSDDSFHDAKDEASNAVSLQNKENYFSVTNNLNKVVPDIVPGNDDIVQFLNSVIVDLQRKNETFLERIQYLEELVPTDELNQKPKKAIAPRMFCDICDMFDLHETEDCPKQSSSSPVPVKNVTKTRPLPRPYCEVCEEFGHNKEDYDHEETY